MKQQYRVREVDGLDEEIATDITWMHDVCFGKSAPQVDPAIGCWWIAFHKDQPVAFAGLTVHGDYGYLYRAGVLPGHRGHKLQRRLVRAREAKARKLGLQYIVTDTTYNTPSSNALIGAGYKLYVPKNPWGPKAALYWRKDMK